MMTRGPVRHPNFFIVGASRAGTTSLWRYLVQHPDVFMPSKDMTTKEPSFFCDLKPCWAEPYRNLDDYLDLFSKADGKRAIGEASTPYLVSPESPRRLREAYPRARIIVVLRNPADRAFSLYQYVCLLGFESIPTFERALAAEEGRLRDDTFRLHNTFWYYAYLYFNTGLYAAQLERFYAAFPRDQIRVLLYDDLARNPVGTTQEIFRFLEIDDRFEPQVHHFNASRSLLSVRLQHALGHRWHAHPMRDKPERSIADRVRRRLFEANARMGVLRRRTAFAASTRRALLEKYRQDVAQTSALIGRDLGAWYA